MDFLDKIKKTVEEDDLVSQEEEMTPKFISTEVEEVEEEPKQTAKKKTAKKKEEKTAEEPKPAKSDLFDGGPIGELTIDMFAEGDDLVIRSAIAGVDSKDLDIVIENDLVVIKGDRQKSVTEEGDEHFFSECHWGAFKREIVLPVEVDSKRAKAKLNKGILTIRIPIIQKEASTKVSVE